MSKVLGGAVQLLNVANNNVAQANANWVDVDGADELLFRGNITGTCDFTIDFDFLGDNTACISTQVNSSNYVHQTIPVKQVRVYCNNCGANEAINVKMVEVYKET